MAVIRSFADAGTRDVFHGRDSGPARRACPIELRMVARRKLDQVNQAEALEDLRVPPGNRLERLRGERRGQHSIRVNERYRVCFRWTEEGPEKVEIVDYHG